MRSGHSTHEERQGSARVYAEAQRYRIEREPVPCFLCGQREGCRHRRAA